MYSMVTCQRKIGSIIRSRIDYQKVHPVNFILLFPADLSDFIRIPWLNWLPKRSTCIFTEILHTGSGNSGLKKQISWLPDICTYIRMLTRKTGCRNSHNTMQGGYISSKVKTRVKSGGQIGMI